MEEMRVRPASQKRSDSSPPPAQKEKQRQPKNALIHGPGALGCESASSTRPILKSKRVL